MLHSRRLGLLFSASALLAISFPGTTVARPKAVTSAKDVAQVNAAKSFKKPVPLGFTKLVVEDVNAMSRFYGALCGFEEEGRADAEIAGNRIREVYFKADPPGTGTFTLTKFLDARRPVTNAVILGFIAPNIDEFVAKATKAGGTVVEGVKRDAAHGVKVAFVRDIEGNLIEVVELL